ncbi:MAG: class I SAM-dependent methyltransferase [Anaerolineae bacterium]|nr:class I SAM-dependent methyltransferase [Anaerolineae bacterium]
MGWIIVVLVLVLLIGLLLYWQLILAEGTYLGAPLVALLYDWTAERYNKIKEFDKKLEDLTLGKPLANRLYRRPEGMVLDIATGTGRVPLTLFDQPGYRGQVIGLDRASKMLHVAQRETAGYQDRITFIQADAMALPFANASFPAVACLEALEFFPDPQKGLAEMIRVLQPASATHPDSGWLLTTNRVGWETYLLPGKTWRREELAKILNNYPLRHIDIRPWEDIYNLVWAQKVEFI